MTTGTKNTNKTVAKIITAALAVLFLMLIIALIVNLVRLGAANDRAESLRAQNERLERLIEDGKNMIDYCNSSEFVEEYAREYLDMVYRGETVIGGK